jgi:hypothetical protein
MKKPNPKHIGPLFEHARQRRVLKVRAKRRKVPIRIKPSAPRILRLKPKDPPEYKRTEPAPKVGRIRQFFRRLFRRRV